MQCFKACLLYTSLDADAQKKDIVIEGKDTDATFHGVATLQMMFSLSLIHIQMCIRDSYISINHIGFVSAGTSQGELEAEHMIDANPFTEWHTKDVYKRQSLYR